MLSLELLLRVGGVLHFTLLIASAMVPRVLNWREELGKVSPFLRRLVWVYGGFIVLVIIGFGVISIAQAAELAAGGPLARWVCGFIAVFWLARLGTQLVAFDIRPVTNSVWMRLGYHVLTIVFVYLTVVFGLAAFGPL